MGSTPETNGVASDLQQDWDAQYGDAAPALEQQGLAVRAPAAALATLADAERVVGDILRLEAAADCLEQQYADVVAKLRRFAGFLRTASEPALRAFAAEQLEGKKAKSLALVTGVGEKPTKIGFRKLPGGLRVVEPEKALAWADETFEEPEHAEFVRVTVKRAPVADRFKAHYADTGEIPPGCEASEDEDKFYIK